MPEVTCGESKGRRFQRNAVVLQLLLGKPQVCAMGSLQRGSMIPTRHGRRSMLYVLMPHRKGQRNQMIVRPEAPRGANSSTTAITSTRAAPDSTFLLQKALPGRG